MADFGAHNSECANADGGDCYCDCKGTMHGIRHMGGKLRNMADVQVTATGKGHGRHYLVQRRDTGLPPGGGTPTERRRAERAGQVRVTASTTTATMRHELPADLVDDIGRTRASLPKTAEGWNEPLTREPEQIGKMREALEFDRRRLADLHEQRTRRVEQFRRDHKGIRLSKSTREATLKRYTGDLDREIDWLTSSIPDQERYLADDVERAKGKMHYPTSKHRDSPWTLVPPPEYERHLSRVMEVGRRVLAEMRKAGAEDPQLRQHTRAHEEARVRWEAIRGDLRIPRADRTAANQAYHDTKARALRREQEILAELLSSAREFGGRGHEQVTTLGEAKTYGAGVTAEPARDDAREVLGRAEQFYPADWLRESAKRPLVLGVDPGQRAYYWETEHLLAMLPDGVNPAYEGAHGRGTGGHLLDNTIHEMGHRMEQTIPGLTHLEFTLVRRRSTAHDGEVEKTQPIYGSDAEVGFRDTWANPYTGKTYERQAPDHPAGQPWEVFQVGVQDVWSRTRNFDRSEDLQQFVIGALLTLG